MWFISIWNYGIQTQSYLQNTEAINHFSNNYRPCFHIYFVEKKDDRRACSKLDVLCAVFEQYRLRDYCWNFACQMVQHTQHTYILCTTMYSKLSILTLYYNVQHTQHTYSVLQCTAYTAYVCTLCYSILSILTLYYELHSHHNWTVCVLQNTVLRILQNR